MGEEPFEPRLGRMRSSGSRRGRKHLHAVLAAAARAGFLGQPHQSRCGRCAHAPVPAIGMPGFARAARSSRCAWCGLVPRRLPRRARTCATCSATESAARLSRGGSIRRRRTRRTARPSSTAATATAISSGFIVSAEDGDQYAPGARAGNRPARVRLYAQGWRHQLDDRTGAEQTRNRIRIHAAGPSIRACMVLRSQFLQGRRAAVV
jgi:hypothetical protein